MKFSTKQAALIFRRAQRRYKVTRDFLVRNMTAMLKFVQYAITPRIVLKCKLVRRRNRVFLKHNYLQKLLFDPTKLKKRRNAKRLHSQWSKRIVMHLRRSSVIEYVEEEQSQSRRDVSEQLKEQLELLKSGKRTVPLLEEPNSSKPADSIRLPSIEVIAESDDVETVSDSWDFHERDPAVPLLTAVHITEEEFNGTTSEAENNKRSNGNFLDMLISKVKHKTGEICESDTSSPEKLMEPPKQYRKSNEKDTFDPEERENSNSSSDFFGFEDNERVLGNFPGMLSTPLVRKRDSNSAFVSETLNAYMRDNSLESAAAVNYPQRRPDDGLLSKHSIPPKLDMPALPEGLQGLRTVAERRVFLQRTKNIRYCIINNVATIFRELQKNSKGHRIYKQAIESVISSSSVPMTRQGWKAAAWLLTDMGNYYCQTITVDGENVRLYGGRGNYQTKFRKAHSNCVKKNKVTICPKNCIDRVTFRSFRPIRSPEKRVKLNNSSQLISCKPCPLSYKILQRAQDEESVFASLDIVRMPMVELEVFPQLQRPLPEIAKRYLQLILPYDEISREWAEFSVSTLLDSQNNELATKFQKSFTFRLPYANDRNHVIIRRVYNRSEDFDDQFDSSSYSFRKELGQNNVKEDLLSIECANVLSDMLDSVAIACSENSFIKNDPDIMDLYAGNEDSREGKSSKKTEPHQQQAQTSHKKQSRLLNELRRLNATVIDAATSKSEEGGTTCGKECCKLGCLCASLNEGTTIRQHCGKQRCVFQCKCKCPSVMHLETDGRTITTEDAFMLRRQATAKLARVEKEFTSTIVLTGNETLLINESQYDKKRRCTKIPKRYYGDFVDHDDPDSLDSKSSNKRTETPTPNFPLEPILVNDKVYTRLKHCSVQLKRIKDVKDLAPWCMIHMVYKCFCKGQATLGNPIVIEKQEETTETAAAVDESTPKNRSLYSFEKEECPKDGEKQTNTSDDDSTDSCDETETTSDISFRVEKNNTGRRGRISDNHYVDTYMNAKANYCRRVVPIPRNIYKRRNKKRLAHVQLYIEEHENEKTRLSLSEHILRSVYYHKDLNKYQYNSVKVEDKEKLQEVRAKFGGRMDSTAETKLLLKRENDSQPEIPIKKRRMSMAPDAGKQLLACSKDESSVEHRPPPLKGSPGKIMDTPKYVPAQPEEIKIPKISQIFSLNTGTTPRENEIHSPPSQTPATTAAPIPPHPEPTSAIEMSEAPTDDMALAHGFSTDAFKNVFQQVIKNMNNLVSKKMQDIDMALRRESKAIPAPNAEILCIIRWNNFLEAYLEGFVYLWEVRTGGSLTFLAATIKPIMPLVMNALSVINIQAISRNKLPLLGRMLTDRKRSTNAEGLAVVMQGQKLYWIVKGFLRPDKTRICPKPTPDSHPLLTRKINILCRLLINNQFNEHKKRRDAIETSQALPSPQMPMQSSPAISLTDQQQQQQPQPPESVNSDQNDSNSFAQSSSQSKPPTSSTLSIQPPQPQLDQTNISLKLKVLLMQRNISDQATTILEQMVSQAYGFVRTNISFRKIRHNELSEIFPPTKLTSNHHWLVLDVSNDFSHIFIPELKDLLTLDRIQKVISYSETKNRIVKMQFSPKSQFNAYVTPRSQKKLYFGPFRQSVTPPKLILLQSVDGQMMLREVYESRHNVAKRTANTTAFWVVQKSGRIFLDVEQETSEVRPSVEKDSQETSSVSLDNLNNYNISSVASHENSSVDLGQMNNYSTCSVVSHETSSVDLGQMNNYSTCSVVSHETSSVDLGQMNNYPTCSVASHETPSVNLSSMNNYTTGSVPSHETPSVNLSSMNNYTTRSVPQSVESYQGGPFHSVEQNCAIGAQTAEQPQTLRSAFANFNDVDDYDEDDDDCMIVEDQPLVPLGVASPAAPAVPVRQNDVTPTSSASECVSTTTTSRSDEATSHSDRLNYTISYGGDNSSLVVVQNNSEQSNSMPDAIRNSFTILTTNEQQQSPVFESPEIRAPTIEQNTQDAMPIFDLSQDNPSPLSVQTINEINAGEIILTFPTTDPNTNVSIPAQHLTNFTIQAPVSTTVLSEPCDTLVLTQNTTAPEKPKNITEPVESSQQPTEFPTKWHRNITITKLSTAIPTSPKLPVAEPPTKEIMNIKELPAGVMGPYGWVPARNKMPLTKLSSQQQRPQATPAQSVQQPQRPQATPAQSVQQPQRPQATPAQSVQQPQRPQTTPAQSVQQPQRPQATPAQKLQQLQRPQTTPAQSVQQPPRPQITLSQQGQRIVTGKIITSQQNIPQRRPGGLIVRTPSTINTIIRGQSQSSTGNPTVAKQAQGAIGSVVRMRTPTGISQIVRLQKALNPLPSTKNLATTTSVAQTGVTKTLSDSVQNHLTVAPQTLLKNTVPSTASSPQNPVNQTIRKTVQLPTISNQQPLRKSMPDSGQSQFHSTSVQQPLRKVQPDSSGLSVQQQLRLGQLTTAVTKQQFRKSLPTDSGKNKPAAIPAQVFRKILPTSLQSKPNDGTRQEPAYLVKVPNKTYVSYGKSETASSKQPQLDPLYISENTKRLAARITSQSKVVNAIKTVTDPARMNAIAGHIISPPTNLVGIKRNANGTPISPFQAKAIQNPIMKMSPSKSSTSGTGDSAVAVKNQSVKGIPIDLPRMKKFAIVGSTTQKMTVISSTPAAPETTSSSNSSSSFNTEESSISKNDTVPPSTSATAEDSTPNSTASSVSSSNANVEYGVFYANIDGMPKFVVKRVGEDYLIKVPNFNGILKLAGLSTVHNYLNQYTIQKFGKTAKDIENLEWSFQIQDRSKLSGISKSGASATQGSNNTKTQKHKQNLNEPTESPSPATTTKAMKPLSSSTRVAISDSIDLSE